MQLPALFRPLVPVLLLLGFVACAFAQDKPAVAPVLENSVVKIFATSRLPDLYKPWS